MTSGFFNFFNSMIHRVKSVNARSRRDLSPLRPRRLLAESLEDRQLLAVDVLGMSAAIADNANVIAISSSELSVDAIKLAIQEAAATPGDDVIQLPSGNLEFTSASDEIVIDVDSTSKGAIGIVSDGLTIDAKEFSRVFAVKNGEIYLEGLTLTGGSSDYGGAIANGGDLTLTNVSITGSFADFGGAIANKGDLKIQDSFIVANVSGQDGAAIYEGDFSWTQGGDESPEWSVIPDQVGAKGTTITVDLADYINDGDWEYSFSLGETGSLILATEPTLSSDGVLSFTFIGDSDYYGEADYSAIEVTVTAEKGSESASQTFTVELQEQISMKVGAILSNMDFDAIDLEYFIQDGRGAARRSGYAYADGFPAPSTSVDVSSDDLYVQVWLQDLANAKSGDDQVWDAGDYFLSSVTYKLHLENATLVSLDSGDYNAPYPNVYQTLENGDYWVASSFMNDTKFGFAEALLADVIKIQAIDSTQPVSVTIYQDGTDLTFPVVQRNYGVNGVSKYQPDSVAVNVDPSQTLFVSTISNSSEPLSAIPGSPFTTYKYEPLNPTTSNALLSATLGASSSAPTLTISNTVIASNSSSGDGIIYIADGGAASVYNATIAGNSGFAAAIQYEGNSTSAVTVANSIIVNDSMEPIPSVATAKGNLLNANVAGNVQYQDGALFTDAANLDFSLAQGSEAINIGDDALAIDVEGAALTTDISGAERFVAAVDAGAYEYQGVAPTAPTNLTVSDYLESSKKPVLSWTAATSSDGVDGYYVYNITSDGKTLIATLAGDATSYADLATSVSLVDNSTYTFAVSAFNAFGESDATNVALDTTVPEPPAAPTDFTAGDYNSAKRRLELTWTDVATNETGYYMEYSLDGASWKKSATLAANTTSRTATGLAPGQTYYFRLAAFNDVGYSDWVQTSFDVPGELPADPKDVAFGVYDSATKSATLSWTASENATGYKIQSYDGSDWVDVATQSETSYTVTGMEDFETYRYRVAAYNEFGDSAWVEATVTASAAPGVPRDVTGVFNKASKTATISWKLAAGATGGYYVYEQNYDNGWDKIANVASSSTSYMVQDLDLYTSYTFGVSAFNDEGESAIVPVTVSTIVAPEAPENLTVVDAEAYDGDGSIVIAWDASEGADSYKISILPADGSETPIEVGSTEDTTYELTNLDNFFAYAVFVVAVNSAGESEEAATSFDTYCPPMEAVVVTAGDYDYVNKSIEISWNEVAYTDWYVVALTVNNLTTLVPMEDSLATSVTLTGLDDFADYTCEVTAWNLKGEGTSGSVDFFTLAPPAAPTDAAFGDFVASTGKATLSWTAVDYADSYVVEKEDAGQWVVVPRTDETETSYTASGLEQNNSYAYRVSAVNAAGSSEAVVVTLDTTVAEPPAAPTNFTVGSYIASTHRLPLSWTDVATNETGYYMEYSQDGVTWKKSATMAANTTSRTATGLTPGQTYYFRLAAFNDYGYSDWVETSFDVPAEIPAAPTNLTFGAYDSTKRELEMSWTDNSDDELGFKVQCSYDGTDWFTVETVDANVTTRTATGLVEGRTYYFRVAAYNAYGVSDWATNQITIHVAGKLPPAAPSDLVFSNPVFTTSGVNLDMSWTDNSDNEDRFIVQFSYDNSTWHGAGSTDANVTERTATGLVEGRTYYFRVAAYNSAGYSDWTTGSYDVPFETVNAPTNIVFGEYNNGSVEMSWTDNSNGEASFVVQFSYDGENWHRGGTTDVGVTHRTATNMTPGRLYYFRVAAYQNGTYSDWVADAFQTPSGAPKAPGAITFANYSASDRTVQMAWEDLSSDEIGFNIEYSTDDGNTWYKSGNTSADVAERTATGLRVGQKYEFRVRSFNAYGTSGWTYGEFTVPGDSAVPSAPTNFVFGDYDADAKTLGMSWTDTANNETGYRVQYSVDNGTTWYSAGLYGANTESRTATSVVAGRTYMFRVAAYNGAGLSDWLTSDAYAVEASANIPKAPTNLTFGTYDAETRTVEMSWTDNATNEKGFKVQYSVNGGQSWRDSAYLQANVTSRMATQLVAGRVYDFRVAAYNGYGYSDWLYNSYSVPTTTALPVPTNITFNYLDTRAVLGVSWDDVATDYNVFYKTSTSGADEWFSLTNEGPTATITQVVDGLTYSIRVQSNEGGAVSDWAQASYNTSTREISAAELDELFQDYFTEDDIDAIAKTRLS